MRVIVTGGNGLLGRALVARLLGSGHQVFSVVRPGSGCCRGAEPVFLDLARWEEGRLPAPIDAVIHLAQSGRYRDFPDGTEDVLRVNVEAAGHLLRHAHGAGARCFLMASTGTVYEPYDRGLSEDAPLRPTSFYGASKAAAEALCAGYTPVMRVCCLRLWSLYGPGPSQGLVNRIAGAVRGGHPITIQGTDGLLLAPTHVEDAAQAFQAALEDPRWQGPVNVASPETLSLGELARILGRHMGVAPRLVRIEGAAPDMIPDLTRMKALLPGHAFIPTDEGLRGII